MLKEIINFSCLNFLKEHISYFIFADKKSNRTILFSLLPILTVDSLTDFVRIAGAKVETFFFTTKLFNNFFQTFFSKPLCEVDFQPEKVAFSNQRTFPFCGCKVDTFFIIHQIFLRLFFTTIFNI